jgi:ribulose kinase
MLAGVAAGIFADFKQAVDSCCKIRDVVEPDLKRHEEYGLLFEKYKQVQAALAPVYHK